MRALYFDDKLEYLTDYPDPEPAQGEAKIRVTHAGICNTDAEIIKGYMGFRGVPGHEFVGRVEQCEDRSMLGKRVVGEINIGCGSCSFCRKNRGNHCAKRSVLGILNKDGVMAEYVTLPVRNLHSIPDSLSDSEAVFVEPLAAAFEVLEQISILPSEKVCVLGDGKLGLLVAQVLATAGKVTAAGRHHEKLSLLDEIGIDTVIMPEVAKREFDVVIDCTGSPSGIKAALGAVKPGGKIVLKTTVAKKSQIDLNQFVIDEISLIGSRCGPFPQAIRAIENKQVDLLPMISEVFPLEDGIEAFDYAAEKNTLKVILQITGT